uniref:Uncharacterized protein n=1 Tax=Anopheles farauti TaxID=69004 RepID=A0A182Q3W0_9DIPT
MKVTVLPPDPLPEAAVVAPGAAVVPAVVVVVAAVAAVANSAVVVAVVVATVAGTVVPPPPPPPMPISEDDPRTVKPMPPTPTPSSWPLLTDSKYRVLISTGVKISFILVTLRLRIFQAIVSSFISATTVPAFRLMPFNNSCHTCLGMSGSDHDSCTPTASRSSPIPLRTTMIVSIIYEDE